MGTLIGDMLELCRLEYWSCVAHSLVLCSSLASEVGHGGFDGRLYRLFETILGRLSYVRRDIWMGQNPLRWYCLTCEIILSESDSRLRIRYRMTMFLRAGCGPISVYTH